jgi:predicted amidohydrolase
MLVRIAGVQVEPKFADVSANLEILQQKTRTAAEQSARIVIFPEAFLTGYCFSSKSEAVAVSQTIPGPATHRLTVLADQLNLFLVVGMLERDGERLFNSAVIVGPNGVVGSYRKTHLPFLGVDKYVTPGDQPYAVHDVAGLKMGLLICYDGSFPEASRCVMLAGADLICLPTNWPTGGCGAAEYLTNARAFENTLYFAAVNRIGSERGFQFIGKSRIAGPNGQTICEAWHEEEAIIFADVDPEMARRKHLIRVPGEHEIHRINDRRPDLYAPLTKLPGAE